MKAKYFSKLKMMMLRLLPVFDKTFSALRLTGSAKLMSDFSQILKGTKQYIDYSVTTNSKNKKERILVKCFPNYIVTIKDCVIIPSSDAVVKDRRLLSDRLIFDNNAYVSIGDNALDYYGKTVVLKRKEIKVLNGQFINLCFDGNKNIWHLTFDMLSKFSLLNQIGYIKNAALLVDRRLETFLFAQEYISALNVYHYPIVYLDQGAYYKVDKSYEISSAYTFIRGDTQKNDVFLVRTEFISCFRKNLKDKLIDNGIKRFFIKRGDGRLKNENEVIKILERNDFLIIKPEEYSFYEELGLFAFADCIIGSIGAAFTNIIYCKKNSRVVCIGPIERIGLVDAYANICQFNNVDFYHLNAFVETDLHCGTPGMTFNADLDELHALLEEIL